jgi:hypothetical protein
MANAIWVKLVIDDEDDSFDAFRIESALVTNIDDDTMRKAIVDKMPKMSVVAPLVRPRSKYTRPVLLNSFREAQHSLRSDLKLSNPGFPRKTT